MIKIIENKDQTTIFELTNDKLYLKLSNFGATMMRLMVKDKNDNFKDVILAFEDLDVYKMRDGSYLGAVVGRVANRISNGSFKLNGEEYHLAINNGPNSLHGGVNGFSYQLFDYEIIDDYTIALSYYSKDGEEGYPGNLKFKVIYHLEDNQLVLRYHATSDKDTIINITNHAYFNLSGNAQDISKHYLKIKADKYGHVDKDGLFNGEIENVKGTVFDFNESKNL